MSVERIGSQAKWVTGSFHPKFSNTIHLNKIIIQHVHRHTHTYREREKMKLQWRLTLLNILHFYLLCGQVLLGFIRAFHKRTKLAMLALMPTFCSHVFSHIFSQCSQCSFAVSFLISTCNVSKCETINQWLQEDMYFKVPNFIGLFTFKWHI